MKTYRLLYLSGLVFIISLINANAQVGYEQIRNTDTAFYYLNNPYGNIAEITWTISGGILVGHNSPYTGYGADTIAVLWDDTNRNSANYGLLRVSEVLHWTSGITCSSPEEEIQVESWVRPKVSTDTSDIKVCHDEPFSITLIFEGKPEYRYKWKVYDKENPGIVLEDYTENFTYSPDPSVAIQLPGYENNNSTPRVLEFVITDLGDGFDDNMPGDLIMARKTILVQPKTNIGIIHSNTNLIRR